MGDVTVHHDVRGNRMHLVFSLGGVIALFSAGLTYGALDTRVQHLEAMDEKRPTNAELQSLRDDVADIKQGIREITTRLNARADARKE